MRYPILSNLKAQQKRKHQSIADLSFKIHKLDSMERFLKKQKAMYSQEEKVIDFVLIAVDTISVDLLSLVLIKKTGALPKRGKYLRFYK